MSMVYRSINTLDTMSSFCQGSESQVAREWHSERAQNRSAVLGHLVWLPHQQIQ